MDDIKKFLQTSSIHGLHFISETRNLLKLFWISIITTCFIVAGVLIYQSFDHWGQTPISTTIETLPISELKFPKARMYIVRRTLFQST